MLIFLLECFGFFEGFLSGMVSLPENNLCISTTVSIIMAERKIDSQLLIQEISSGIKTTTYAA